MREGGTRGSGETTAESRRRLLEARLSWMSCLVLFLATVYVTVKMDVLWCAFGISALSLYMLPIVIFRNPYKVTPLEVTLLLIAPILMHVSERSWYLSEHLAWWDDFTALAFAFSMTTLGFLLTVELQMFTSVRLNLPMAGFFVIMFTVAVGGLWQLGEYLGSLVTDSSELVTNAEVMDFLVFVSAGGLLMGFVYYAYVRSLSKARKEILGLTRLYGGPR